MKRRNIVDFFRILSTICVCFPYYIKLRLIVPIPSQDKRTEDRFERR